MRSSPAYAGRRARGRHHPPRGEPHPAGARGPCARRARDAAPALRPRPLARAARGARRALRRRPRQAPVPALRGRPDHPLAPAHDRVLAGDRRRARALARRLAGDPPRRPPGRPGQRPGAGADDGLAHPARPAHRRARAGHPRPPVRLRALPPAPARGRPHAPHRRRRPRPAHDRRDRQPVEGGGLLGRPDRSVAPHGRRLGCRGDRDRRRRPPAHARVRRPRPHDPRGAGLQPGRPPLRALRHAHPGARAVGRQPRHVLVPRMPALRRVGHKGADLIAPGNTRASFDAALGAGVDMIEFDVLPERRPAEDETRLVLAHDYEHAQPDAMTLDEGLAHLAGEAFGAVELDVDLKLPGYEARVVEALRAFGLVERTLVSTQYMRSLVRLRELEPRLRLGWSVPRIRRDYAAWPVLAVPAYFGVHYLRRRLVHAARRHLAAGRCDALMVNWRLVSRALVWTVREEGGELYVWTIDDAAEIRRLEAMGVDAVITNDPRLFGAPDAV